MNDAGRHPHFNDLRSVFWHTSLRDALDQAGRAGKRVFVQIGTGACGGCRALVEKTIPKQEIAEYLSAHYVCVAARSDAPPPEIAALLGVLPRREPTPVCVYLDATGRPVHSTVGGRPAAVFLRDMTEGSVA